MAPMGSDWLNELRYAWRRSRWMVRPDLWALPHESVPLDRPVFMTGVQGGALTVLFRMLVRLPASVTVGGDRRYWGGADEMHVVLRSVLPESLRLVPEPAPYGKNVGWVYASDALLPKYRRTAIDLQPADAAKFRRLVRGMILLNSRDYRAARFLDKSQSYAVRVPLIREILPGSRFLGILRNPYAMCHHAAAKKDLRRVTLPLEDRVRLAAEHWRNTSRCLREEADREDMLLMRVEDVLASLPEQMARMAGHAQLPWDPAALPKASDRLPLGSRRRERWFPVRTEINSRNLEALPDWAEERITEVAGEEARAWGYMPSGRSTLSADGIPALSVGALE